MPKLKTINIKGKEYVTVAERLRFFNETFKNGSISTELLSRPEDQTIVIKATVKVGDQTFTGHSQAVIGEGYINKTAALENAETSAVGRALGMMGIGIIESVASADEVIKATKPTFKRSTNTNRWSGHAIKGEDVDYSPADEGEAPYGTK